MAGAHGPRKGRRSLPGVCPPPVPARLFSPQLSLREEEEGEGGRN